MGNTNTCGGCQQQTKQRITHCSSRQCETGNLKGRRICVEYCAKKSILIQDKWVCQSCHRKELASQEPQCVKQVHMIKTMNQENFQRTQYKIQSVEKPQSTSLGPVIHPSKPMAQERPLVSPAMKYFNENPLPAQQEAVPVHLYKSVERSMPPFFNIKHATDQSKDLQVSVKKDPDGSLTWQSLPTNFKNALDRVVSPEDQLNQTQLSLRVALQHEYDRVEKSALPKIPGPTPEYTQANPSSRYQFTQKVAMLHDEKVLVFKAQAKENTQELYLIKQGSCESEEMQSIAKQCSLEASIQCDLLLKLKEVLKFNGRLFVILESIEGYESITKYATAADTSDDVIKSILRGIAQALAALHSQSRAMGELTCQKVIFNQSTGTVKMLTAGTAYLSSQLKDQTFTPQSVPYTVTPQFESRPILAKPTKEDNIWALGCVAYELAAGCGPFDRVATADGIEQNSSVLNLIAKARYPQIPNSGGRAGLIDFIGSCLKVEPDQRATAQALLDHPFLRS